MSTHATSVLQRVWTMLAVGTERGIRLKTRMKWCAIALMLLLPGRIVAQEHAPRLIDVHVHYNGEPGVLAQILQKMQQVLLEILILK